MSGRKRILVVGGGFGGMYAARALEHKVPPGLAEIVLVNPENFMLYTPLLAEAASGTIEPRHVAVPLRRVLRRSRLIVGKVTGIDVDRHTSEVEPPEGETRTFAWDYLVLAPGSIARLLPIPGLVEHARGFKTLPEAIYLRNHVLQQLELADATDDAGERQARCTFVVVGAGYAGTELVGELQSLTTRALKAYPGLRPRDIRWILVDAAPQIMPELGKDLGRVALRILRQRGIEVRLETQVKEVGPDWVRLFRGLGLLVNLGEYQGVARVLGISLRGFPGWFVTRTYHLAAMPTWGRRLRVMLDWTIALAFPRDIAELGSLGRDDGRAITPDDRAITP